MKRHVGSFREHVSGNVAILTLCLLTVALLALVPTPRAAVRPNPLAGARLYVDGQQNAASAVQSALDQGRTQDAEALERIASQPVATWLNGESSDAQVVRQNTQAAKRTNTVASFVVYNIVNRDACSDYSAGGANTEADYRRWIDSISAAIDGPTIMIVEPDAVGDLLDGCLPTSIQQARYRMLSDAVQRLKSAGATVYLDAVNALWFKNPSVLVAPLVDAGVVKADGVAVNVSHFVATPDTVRWAQQLLEALERRGIHKGAVIDTSRNGNGAYTGPLSNQWCNPPGRALGRNPTTHTGQNDIDAYLWVKAPGESDGDCRPGEPKAGEFWEAYALGLVRGNSP